MFSVIKFLRCTMCKSKLRSFFLKKTCNTNKKQSSIWGKYLEIQSFWSDPESRWNAAQPGDCKVSTVSSKVLNLSKNLFGIVSLLDMKLTLSIEMNNFGSRRMFQNYFWLQCLSLRWGFSVCFSSQALYAQFPLQYWKIKL